MQHFPKSISAGTLLPKIQPQWFSNYFRKRCFIKKQFDIRLLKKLMCKKFVVVSVLLISVTQSYGIIVGGSKFLAFQNDKPPTNNLSSVLFKKLAPNAFAQLQNFNTKNEYFSHTIYHQRRQLQPSEKFFEFPAVFKTLSTSNIKSAGQYSFPNKLQSISPSVLSLTTLSLIGSTESQKMFSSSFLFNKKRSARQSGTTKSFLKRNNTNINNNDSLQALYAQLEILRPCNRTIDTPLVRQLLSDATKSVVQNLSAYLQLYQLNPVAVYPFHLSALIQNSSITDSPAAFPLDRTSPAYVLKLLCNPTPKWTPIIVYTTQIPNSFLQIYITDFLKLNACSLSSCSSKCSYTVHNHLPIYARSCCKTNDPAPNFDNNRQFCREDLRLFKRIFYAISVLFALGSIVTIALAIRERIRLQQEARGWALMEPFFFGAAFLYIVPLLDWYEAEQNSCIVAVWLRIIGFTLFYGSILLKIFRNLQEYRVRKAHHVIVREQDLLKYLIIGLSISFLALFVYTVSSSKNIEMWESSWPQCPMDITAQLWAAWELIALLYGMRLCYKARSSSWVERYQFTLAICLEAIVTLTVNLIRYSLRNAGSNDVLFIVTIIQLHFTVSVNITAIITPKFLITSETSRQTLAMSGIGGNSGRAHPSLAKLRDNLVNGTIDFADIPITDMNAEDIRAELKRVYTQLRMYKLKNIYQDNPHISKRKGGAKKIIDKTSSKNRRISIPPPPSNASSNSPKVRRLDEVTSSCLIGEDDEKNDLTVESAPHNVCLSTLNKVRFFDASIANDQTCSVRV